MFNVVVEFMLDADVPVEERAQAARVFASTFSTPRWVKKRLENGLPHGGPDIPILGSPIDLDLASAELMLAFRSVGDLAALPLLLAAGASNETSARLGLAHVLIRQSDRLDPTTGMSLMMSLAVDRDPNVRGAAAYGLGKLLPRLGDAAQVAQEKVLALAVEPGVAVPRGAWSGLSAAADAGYAVSQTIRGRASFVSREHLSWSVREAASRLALDG
jgi:hypothetical protein